jgi:hypothetical protein
MKQIEYFILSPQAAPEGSGCMLRELFQAHSLAEILKNNLIPF